LEKIVDKNELLEKYTKKIVSLYPSSLGGSSYEIKELLDKLIAEVQPSDPQKITARKDCGFLTWVEPCHPCSMRDDDIEEYT